MNVAHGKIRDPLRSNFVMALHLKYFGDTTIPVEVEGLTPDWACDKSLAEIERFTIFEGNRQIPLAEMFAVSGDPSDRRCDWEGDLSGVHWIGAHMTAGQIHIQGSVGRHLGSSMRGGEIRVSGEAGGWVGAEMHGGSIYVQGNAGHLVGAAYRGSPKGMTGGTILVGGNVGHEVGLSMRRGLIAVAGSAGDLIGFNMIAGTVLVFGGCGIRAGAGMRRGTIGLFGPQPPPLLPSFRFATTLQPQIVRVLLRDVVHRGLKIDQSLLTAEFDIFRGDLVSTGRGEVLMPTTARL